MNHDSVNTTHTTFITYMRPPFEPSQDIEAILPVDAMSENLDSFDVKELLEEKTPTLQENNSTSEIKSQENKESEKNKEVQKNENWNKKWFVIGNIIIHLSWMCLCLGLIWYCMKQKKDNKQLKEQFKTLKMRLDGTVQMLSYLRNKTSLVMDAQKVIRKQSVNRALIDMANIILMMRSAKAKS